VRSKRNSATQLSKANQSARRLGLFRARDFAASGYSREYLRRLAGSGQVQQLGRGLYASVDFDADQNFSLVQAAKLVPRGVVCLVSALSFHQIGTQAPHQVWLALPRGTKFPRVGSLPFRFCKFSPPAHEFGVEEHRLSGGSVRIYTPAKSVADCFKFRNRIGSDVAIEALRDGWAKKRFTMDKLLEAAEVCRVARILRPYLEMLI
jgi:predicted transcriptional regulator of viral defense system